MWCPYLVKDILALEKVQRRASRLALGQKRGEMEYEERIKILNWPTSGLNSLKFSDFFELALVKTTRATTLLN